MGIPRAHAGDVYFRRAYFLHGQRNESFGLPEEIFYESVFQKRFVRVGRALILGSIACYLLFGLLPGLFYGAQSIADGFGPVDFCKRFLTNSIIDIY